MALKLERGLKLVVATHNPGKVPEIAALLDGRFELVAAGTLGLPEPEETESTFVGNALLKARHAAELSGMIAIADDSGLSVAALGGDPGLLLHDRGQGERVVAVHQRVRPQLTQVLDEVVDERVVVVDHEDPAGHRRTR